MYFLVNEESGEGDSHTGNSHQDPQLPEFPPLGEQGEGGHDDSGLQADLAKIEAIPPALLVGDLPFQRVSFRLDLFQILSLAVHLLGVLGF